MPATTAAPMVPPETPLSEELDVVAGWALPVDEVCVVLAVEVPEVVAVLPVVPPVAFRVASLLKSAN